MIPWFALLYVYGVILIVGGVIGYAKAKSVPSLVAGGVSGLIAIFIGYRYPWHYAPEAALILSLVLLIIMGRRYLKTGKFMPALLVVILSIIVAIAQIYVLLVPGPGNEPLL